MTTNTTKRARCLHCNAAGGKRHRDGCPRVPANRGRNSARCFTPATPPKLKNKVALVIDSSGSMQGLQYDVVRVINDQIRELKKNAAKTGQETTLTIYSFADRVSCIQQEKNVFEIQSFSGYSPRGNTALLDAVAQSISDLSLFDGASDPNTSFLIITITDGEENKSKIKAHNLVARMREVTKTDRWTFVFSVPLGAKHTAISLGIDAGNIQEWDQTTKGIESLGHVMTAGISHYYGVRSSGATRSANFFQPDLSQVSRSAILNLTDVSSSHRVWDVDSVIQISDFVNVMLRNQPALAAKIGTFYELGRAYYELTKAEEVQYNKDIIVQDRSTNALYGGQQARSLIGCPMNISFKIKPGNHLNYRIFIKSTSVNRKLMPGTKMVYFVG